MKLEIFKPSPPLKEYVQFFWMLEDSPSPSASAQRVIPTGLPELMIDYGDRIVCSGDKPGAVQPRMSFCGQRNTFFDVWQTGNTRLMSAVFTPLGASHFYSESFSGILNGSVSLNDMFPSDAKRLYDMLCSAGSSADKASILESFILGKMNTRFRKDYTLLSGIISAIRESRGAVTIGTICDQFGINSKFLERRFSDYIGMPPKSYLRIVRFQNAIDCYSRSRSSLTDFSLDCGYYDQSHFIREIREFTGYSPGELFSTCSVHSDFFAA